MNRTHTVLLADDEVAVCTMLQHALASAGFDIIIAHDGQEAVAQYQGHGKPVAALITDLQMPVMGGLDLARALMRVQPALPIIFMSGNPESTEMPTVGEFPKHAFLAKPFVPTACLARLSTLLAS